jgi:cysteine desulfurase
MTGGGQENGLRCGTENVCGNRAFARAAELWISNMHETSGHVQSLRDRVQRGLVDAIDDVEVLGDPDARLPHILCLAIRRVRGEVVMHHLEENGIYVSTGSACASSSRAKANTGSHVLEAMQLPQELINGTLRISFGRLNTDADADAVLQAMPAVVEQLRALGV